MSKDVFNTTIKLTLHPAIFDVINSPWEPFFYLPLGGGHAQLPTLPHAGPLSRVLGGGSFPHFKRARVVPTSGPRPLGGWGV
jgi:hypothetical protein